MLDVGVAVSDDVRVCVDEEEAVCVDEAVCEAVIELEKDLETVPVRLFVAVSEAVLVWVSVELGVMPAVCVLVADPVHDGVLEAVLVTVDENEMLIVAVAVLKERTSKTEKTIEDEIKQEKSRPT